MIATLWLCTSMLIGAQTGSSLTNASLASSLLPSTAASDEEGAPTADNVLRIYDISTLGSTRRSPKTDMSSRWLLPYTQWLGSWEEYGEERSTAGPWQAVVSTIEGLYSSEFEYEGRRLRTDRQGRMLVRAPLALHQEIERFLSFLDETLLAQVDVRVERVLLPLKDAAPFGGRSIVTAQAAQDWLAGLSADTPRESHSLSLRPDRPTQLNLYQEMPILYDYDVAIAQASAIADPIVMMVGLGTRLELRGTPSPNGLLLTMRASSGELIGKVRQRDMDLTHVVFGDRGVQEIPVGGVAQDMDVFHHSLALDTLLQPGKALVMHMNVDLELANRREVLILSLESGHLPHVATFHNNLNAVDLFMANVDFSDPQRLHSIGTLMGAGPLLGSLRVMRHGGRDGLLGTEVHSQRPDAGIDEMRRVGEDLWGSEIGHWYVLYPRDSGEPGAQGVAAVRRVVSELPAPVAPIDVRVVLRRADGSIATSCSLPVVPGHSGALAIGIEGFDLADYDVEVAQNSSIRDPQVHSTFDGLLLWMKPNLSHSGDLVLEVRGVASIAEEGSRFELHGTRGISFEQARPHVLAIHEKVLFAHDADGPWSRTFGSALVGGGGLTLELSIQR